MKVIPKTGYILVSEQELAEEKKPGALILLDEEKKKTYLRVESDGELYFINDCVLSLPFKTKMLIKDNLFLIAEEDIVASFTV